jgi:GntR family transcriptional regulator, carbon starvation induced regulator
MLRTDVGQGGRISRATMTEQLEEALRADILDGVLVPGRRLRASELTGRYGVSATPLREALQRLAAENLVDLDPRIGATVSAISQDDLLDVYEMLGLVGGMALERSVKRAVAPWDASVQHAFDAMHLASERLMADGLDDDAMRRSLAADAATAHWEFHDALYQRCGSPWLLRFAKMLHAHAERYRRLSIQAARDRRDIHAEHEAIMLAARRGDAGAAVGELRGHFEATVSVLLELFGSPEPGSIIGMAAVSPD